MLDAETCQRNPALAESLFNYSGGHPHLTGRCGDVIDETSLPDPDGPGDADRRVDLIDGLEFEWIDNLEVLATDSRVRSQELMRAFLHDRCLPFALFNHDARRRESTK